MSSTNNVIKEADKSPLVTARIAGFFYLLLGIFAGFSHSFRSSHIIPGNAAATVNNILASEPLFRISIVSDLTGQVCFILTVVFLYKLLKTVNKNQALLMAILALVSIPIACLNIVTQVAALILSNGTDFLKTFNSNQLQAGALFFLDLNKSGILIAGIFWGLWLFPLGYLVFKSGFLPRVSGVFLIIAGTGYVFDSITHILFTNPIVAIAQYTFIGEVLILFWLLIRGVNIEKWKKHISESAAAN